MTRYEYLKKRRLLSWSTVKWGLENNKLLFSDIIDYAIDCLEKCNDDERIAILSGLNKTDEDLMRKIIRLVREPSGSLTSLADLPQNGGKSGCFYIETVL